MKVKFRTLGCKVNQYDTQSIRERFLERGFHEARGNTKSDLYLINTCTVTSSADQKSRSLIRSCIRENPGAKIIVTGCLAELDSHMIEGINKKIIIIRNADKEKIPGLLNLRTNALPAGRQELANSRTKSGISSFKGHTRAFLKIQDGCDNFCSYCKVPLVRGRPRSRPLSEIVDEARVLAGKGFKEIVLTGICLGSYSHCLVDLISALEKIPGILRIRLSSIEAGDVSDELINKISKSKKLCPHLHIPIQSGDDEILKKMKRRYSRKFYLGLINKIKKTIPRVSITTDCLVGFPGESERNFRNTLSLIKKIMPLRVHIFPYSKREGTYAANNFKDIIGPKVIKERVTKLKALADNCMLNYKKRFLGKKMPVLFECLSKEKKGYWEGYTDNYIKAFLRSREPLKNKIINLDKFT